MIRQLLIAFAVLLLAGGFLLIWDSPPEAFMRAPSAQVDEMPAADAYMTGVSNDLFGKQGALRYHISSPRVELYQQSGKLRLANPFFRAKTIDDKQISLRAINGTLDNPRRALTLYGDVELTIAPLGEQSGQSDSILLTSQQLSYNLEESLASTSGEFHLVTGSADIRGEDLSADLNTQHYKIAARVRATHDPI